MENILSKTLNLVSEIIDYTEVRSLTFYESVIKLVSSLYEDSVIGIYFLENTEYILKCAVNNKKIIKDLKIEYKILASFIESNKKTITIDTNEINFLKKYTVFTKLSIRGSIFGFALLSLDNKPDNDVVASFNTLVNAISYKIKDYELNEVFKLQLKALQDAILEKEEACEIVKKQHKKLKEIDKAKSLFLANISHELRTPLNAIIGFSQALDSQIFGELNEKQSEYVKDIQISGLHLLGMINEILDISKLEAKAMKFTPVELSPTQAIEEVVNILEPLYKNKNISVEFKALYDGKILADYQKFQQILYNLLSNAIKFTPQNGKIVINSSAEGGKYFLSIKDNGIGIDKKYHNKIFKKFVHLNNVYTKQQSSTGLGLTITKELVKLHNGKIILESELNKGTTFKMEFKNIII